MTISLAKPEKKATKAILAGPIRPAHHPEEPISYQVAIPGSGMTPIAFPSPGISFVIVGRYELAKAGDAVHKSAPMPRSVFVSKSSRFGKAGAQEIKLPGPGWYHPLVETKQSFHLNIEGKFV